MKNALRTFLLVVVIAVPIISLAQGTGGIVPCNGPECQACHVVRLGQNILTWVIGVMASIIAIVFAVAGFKMVMAGGDTGQVSQARSMMTNAVIGFVILLSSWLIIDTIMKLVVSPGASTGGIQLGMWHTIQCVPQPVRLQTTTTPGTIGTVPTTPTTPLPGSSLSHADAVAQLGGINVVSRGNCTSRTQRNCTSLEGMQPDALAKIKDVITSCSNCNLEITSGTEVGHSNPCHTNGTCVDIRCKGGCSPQQITAVNASAKANGSNVVYETISCAARDAARAQGITAYCQSDRGYGHITGDHFSLYTR